MIWAWYHAAGRRAVLRGARGPRVPRRRLDADHRPGLRDPGRRAGHGREQRRLLPLPLRARHRRHPRGRVHHRRHLQEDDRRRRQLHPRGLRPRARRAAGEGLRHLPLVDHADRPRQRARPLDLHRAEGERRGGGRAGRRVVLRRRLPGHPDLGEQDLQGPAGHHEDREADPRAPPLVAAVLQRDDGVRRPAGRRRRVPLPRRHPQAARPARRPGAGRARARRGAGGRARRGGGRGRRGRPARRRWRTGR